MSVFGFIENFFFISLALVFVLVLLLVYHFKNRITVAEKKSESMYGLLTAVVKEIKTLRGMFGLGGNENPPTIEPSSSASSNFDVKSKTTPEVNIITNETQPQENEQPQNQHNFATFIQPREVINLDFAASDNKIVVSDVEDSSDDEDDDDDDSSVSDDSGSNSDSDSESDTNSVHEHEQEPSSTSVDLGVEINVNDITDILPTSEPVMELELSHVESVDVESILETIQQKTEIDVEVREEATTVNLVEMLSSPLESETANAIQIPTIDQLRKMNINQLKTIASQIGITADISKMKKPELISLIQSH